MGLSYSVALKLIKLNVPMYNTWSSNNPVSTIAAVGTDLNHDTMQNNEVPEKLTKQWIINSPKYRHLFQGIGKFKINPVGITLQKIQHQSPKTTKESTFGYAEGFQS